MKVIKRINSRAVSLIEVNSTQHWSDQLPTHDWLCVLVSDTQTDTFLNEVLATILARNSCYLCAVGEQSERVHDLADEHIVYQDVVSGVSFSVGSTLLTTWHKNMEEGIWFSIYGAIHEQVDIEAVAILDLTQGKRIAEIEATLSKVALEG